jgi:hypothetical protein
VNRSAGPDLLSTPRPPRGAPPQRAAPEIDALAVAAFVLGLLGLALITVLPLVLAGPAAVIGLVARRRISREPARHSGRPLATGGVIMGVIGVLVPILAVVTL